MSIKCIKVIIRYHSLILEDNHFAKWPKSPELSTVASPRSWQKFENYQVDKISIECIKLFINSGLLGESFWQKVNFLVKMDSRNQPGSVPLILSKNQKLLKRINRMFMKYIKVIIRDYLSILGQQVDHFVKKSTFWSKWTPQISLVASPRSWQKFKNCQKGSTKCLYRVIIWNHLLICD